MIMKNSKLNLSESTTIIKLDNLIVGVGDSKGYTYIKHTERPQSYVYKVVDTDDHTKIAGYEVFEKILVPKMLDFKTKTYVEDVAKEQYPKPHYFGCSAWFVSDEERAMEIIEWIEGGYVGTKPIYNPKSTSK